MDREEILRRSKLENAGQDEFEKTVEAEAGKMAAAVGGIVCTLLILLEAILSGNISLTPWIIYQAMLCVNNCVRYYHYKDKCSLRWAITQGGLAVCLLFVFTYKLVR